MSTLTKMALAAFAGLLLGGGALALGQDGADNGLTTTETTTVEQPGDVSGPCDEAEHANDPRCNGAQGQKDGRRDDDDTTERATSAAPATRPSTPTTRAARAPAAIESTTRGQDRRARATATVTMTATVRTTPVPAMHRGTPVPATPMTTAMRTMTTPARATAAPDRAAAAPREAVTAGARTTTEPAPEDRADGRGTRAGGSRPVAVSPLASTEMPDKGRPDILLVEDETAITEPLAEALEREGFSARVAGTAAEALSMAASREPDLVLLDIGLPDGSGLDVCRTLRQGSNVPVIMLTARGSEADRVAGLELGADDYVVKPFSAREVTARVRAVLRRAGGGPGPGETIEIGKLRLDPDRHSATLDAKEIELSRKEFKLLQTLMERAGTVITRQALLEEVWDMNWFGSTKTLDVHMSGLRKKLGDDASDPRYIHTVRGVGFRFAAPDEA